MPDAAALLDALQWPAMVVTVVAAWLVGSRQPRKRAVGFWLFLASNVLWVVWGLHTRAWALITLQVFLAVFNLRGAFKNDPPGDAAPPAAGEPIQPDTPVPAAGREAFHTVTRQSAQKLL